MKAKFDGKCRECGGGVYVGDEVRWHGRGKGVSHADESVCQEFHELRAEQQAEMRFELGTQYSALVREYGFTGV